MSDSRTNDFFDTMIKEVDEEIEELDKSAEFLKKKLVIPGDPPKTYKIFTSEELRKAFGLPTYEEFMANPEKYIKEQQERQKEGRDE